MGLHKKALLIHQHGIVESLMSAVLLSDTIKVFSITPSKPRLAICSLGLDSETVLLNFVYTPMAMLVNNNR